MQPNTATLEAAPIDTGLQALIAGQMLAPCADEAETPFTSDAPRSSPAALAHEIETAYQRARRIRARDMTAHTALELLGEWGLQRPNRLGPLVPLYEQRAAPHAWMLGLCRPTAEFLHRVGAYSAESAEAVIQKADAAARAMVAAPCTDSLTLPVVLDALGMAVDARRCLDLWQREQLDLQMLACTGLGAALAEREGTQEAGRAPEDFAAILHGAAD